MTASVVFRLRLVQFSDCVKNAEVGVHHFPNWLEVMKMAIFTCLRRKGPFQAAPYPAVVLASANLLIASAKCCNIASLYCVLSGSGWFESLWSGFGERSLSFVWVSSSRPTTSRWRVASRTRAIVTSWSTQMRDWPLSSLLKTWEKCRAAQIRRLAYNSFSAAAPGFFWK